jgi:hypothetical protein
MRSSSVNLPELARRLARRGSGAEANLQADVQTLSGTAVSTPEALVRRAAEAVATLDAEGLEAPPRRFN